MDTRSSATTGSCVHTGVVIVGAGPSGLAAAACLAQRGVPSVIVERAGCVASLWKERTYDSLHLHLTRDYCSLPMMPIPSASAKGGGAGDSTGPFVSRAQFVEYLESYAAEFGLRPRFNETVRWARFEEERGEWIVRSTASPAAGPFAEGPAIRRLRPPPPSPSSVTTYRSRFLVVASGENAEPVFPPYYSSPAAFRGPCLHSCHFKNASPYSGLRVLVVGSGNSGMEIAHDVSRLAAHTSVVVRSPMHVLPLEVFGMSTFSLAMQLLRSFPVWAVDRFLVSYARVALGDTAAHGIPRPKVGPLELKAKMGKTPVLDVGTLARIKSRIIEVKPAVECLTATGVRYVNGTSEDFDAIIFATGYKSNVLKWLQDKDRFFGPDGMPSSSCPMHWKGEKGLYVAGLCRKGVFGAATDAKLIADDIGRIWSHRLHVPTKASNGHR